MTKNERVRKLLLENCSGYSRKYTWRWLPVLAGPADKIRANRFLLGARMDFWRDPEQAWKNTKILVEEILLDTNDLWNTIASMEQGKLHAIFRGDCMMEECRRHGCAYTRERQEALQNFPVRHSRLHPQPDEAAESVKAMARIISERYDGDARRVWREDKQGNWYSLPADQVRSNLEEIGFEYSRTEAVVQALIHAGQINGENGWEADTNEIRVLGRVFAENEISTGEVFRIAHKMMAIEPPRPFILDERIFGLGQYVCELNDPKCPECCLRDECSYAQDPR